MKPCRFKECLESVDAHVDSTTALETGPGPVCAEEIAPPTKDRAVRKSYSALWVALTLATSGVAKGTFLTVAPLLSLIH